MSKQYLTLRLDKIQYAIEAELVQEVFPLPELTPLAIATTNIIGLLNLRGQIIPILHFNLSKSEPVLCNFNDSVVVINWQGLQFGIIFHQVNEVLNLNTEEIETYLLQEHLQNVNSGLINGLIKQETGKLILLNYQALVNEINAVLPLVWDAQSQLGEISNLPEELKQQEELKTQETVNSFSNLYCANISLEERAVFQQRTEQLKLSNEVELVNKLIPIAIISWGGKYFGLNLELVRGFINITNLTPIPCCPNHIVGNLNLRGEIITLVDIRKLLNIPVAPINIGSQAVLVQVDDIIAGLPIEGVLDTVEFNSLDLMPTVNSTFNLQYFQGTTYFEGKILNVLDLPKIFIEGGIVVNEEV